MVWIILLLSFAMVLGAVLSVRPSRAQVQVAAIRESAIQQGVHVKLPVSLRFPESIEKPRQPFYCKNLRVKAFSNHRYCAIRDLDRIGTSSGDIPASLKCDIDDILLSSDKDINGFYMGDGLIGFSWRESENQQTQDELIQKIAQVEALLEQSV